MTEVIETYNAELEKLITNYLHSKVRIDEEGFAHCVFSKNILLSVKVSDSNNNRIYFTNYFDTDLTSSLALSVKNSRLVDDPRWYYGFFVPPMTPLLRLRQEANK